MMETEMKPNYDKLIRDYFERGGVIVVGPYVKPKKSELTFRNDRGSVYNAGRKAITMRQSGLKGRGAVSG
jgi:hypothetical protein